VAKCRSAPVGGSGCARDLSEVAAAGVRLGVELTEWLARARTALERHSAELEARGLSDGALVALYGSSGARSVHDALDRLDAFLSGEGAVS
jgi:hypothetical protein